MTIHVCGGDMTVHVCGGYNYGGYILQLYMFV